MFEFRRGVSSYSETYQSNALYFQDELGYGSKKLFFIEMFQALSLKKIEKVYPILLGSQVGLDRCAEVRKWWWSQDG